MLIDVLDGDKDSWVWFQEELMSKSGMLWQEAGS